MYACINVCTSIPMSKYIHNKDNIIKSYHYLLKVHKSPPIHQYLRSGLFTHISTHSPNIKQNIEQRGKTHHITTQLLTRQKHRRPRQIRRLAQPSQRNPPLHIRPLHGITHILIIQLSPDRPRQQRITSDAILAQRNRTRLHKTKHTRLRRRIMRLLSTPNKRRDRTNPDNGTPGWRLSQCHLSCCCLCCPECAA